MKINQRNCLEFTICLTLLVTLVLSCNNNGGTGKDKSKTADESEYDTIYNNSGYILLREKDSHGFTDKKSLAPKRIHPDTAKSWVKYYDKDRKNLKYPSHIDFAYDTIFALITQLKDTVGANYSDKAAGLRIYFAEYASDLKNPNSGLTMPVRNYLSTILVGTYGKRDTTQNFNLGDLCPPNCYGLGLPAIRPDASASKLISK